MKTRFARRSSYFAIGLLALTSSWAALSLADEDRTGENRRRASSAHHHGPPNGDKQRVGEFVRQVREATQRFRDPSLAQAEGYALHFGCVSGSDFGAMGLHYVNMSLVGDGELDPMRPEIVIYEPLSNGRLRLLGADFLVLADDWHAAHPAPPELGGQLLHLFGSPNRFGLPAFYTLHVWAWKDNPNGMFVNWHSEVSCDDFSG